MKAINLIFLILCSLASIGQSRHLMNQISIDLSRELEGQSRNLHYVFYFEKKGDNTIQNTRDEHRYPTLTKIISRYVDSIIIGQRYRVGVYHDMYSSKVYAYVDTVIKYDGFPNFDNYLGYPKGGFRFLENIYSELRRHQKELDTLTWNDWSEPIYLFIDSTTIPKIIKANKLVKYLDSSLNVPWSRPMYHARAINSIAEIRLYKHLLNVDIRKNILHRDHTSIQTSYVLPIQYKNQWVRFAQSQLEFAEGIVVSYIFNPITLKVENGIILKGDTEQATRLLEWIEELNLQERMFYWPSMPSARRTYFYIDKYE